MAYQPTRPALEIQYENAELKEQLDEALQF